MKILSAIAVSLAMLAVIPASATEYSDALSSCLADSTNGKDRKALVRWSFIAMAAHPDIRPMAAITNTTQDDVNKEMANLFTRLLTQNCVKELQASLKHDGSQLLTQSMESLGRVAMQEIMSHPAVNSSISGFENYIDQEKLRAALAPQ